jgi:hypothetical protein
MARFNDFRSTERGVVLLATRVPIGASGAVSYVTTRPKGFSVARTAVGTYTITLADRFREVLSVIATPSESAAADKKCIVQSVDEANKTIVVLYVAAAAAADPPSGAFINLTIVAAEGSGA